MADPRQPVFAGMEYEKINADPKLLFKEQPIQLLGYGCREKGGKDRVFGSLYEGQATVKKLPGEVKGDYYGVSFGGAALCFGDSGGGAYASTGGDARVLFAVNSRGDISQNSWLSATSQPGFVSWAKSRAVGICGLDPAARGCRGD
jgi:hypothetical protein